MSLIDLKGKVAVVTGASQGLGEALALRLDKEGCKVAVCDINFEGAQAVANKLSDAIALAVDVTKYDQLEEAAKAGDYAYVLHRMNNEAGTWEVVGQGYLGADLTVTGTFTNFSPVAVLVVDAADVAADAADDGQSAAASAAAAKTCAAAQNH